MNLKEFFEKSPKTALALSGGVDSAYLLYAALQWGADIRPYFVKTPFQPRFELEDARALAGGLGAELRVLEVDILALPEVAANPPERCYFCKKGMFSAIARAAGEEGCPLVVDGTNASDPEGDRPGMRALRELGVRSPLRECGLTKKEVRRLSREAGLSVWDKPAYACLATRIPTNTPITPKDLERTGRAEDFLISLGLRDLRVRLLDGCARIQVPEERLAAVLERREEILKKLGQDYGGVLLDLEVRNGA
ncbi:ATP-dependent sacrificial sulfur transferase LarE [Oscillospiraceae bacterium 50-16]